MSESTKKRARVEELRAQQAKARAAKARRRKLLIVVSPIVAVVVVIAVMVIVKTTSGKKTDKGPTAANSATVQQLTSIPAATLSKAGGPSSSDTLISVAAKSSAQPLLTKDGKARIVYIGAEYCPYCAAERWPTIIALSRFGTFSGLQQAKSSSSDVYPSTATWTFRSAKYTSQYVSFEAVETEDSNQKALQTPSSDQQALLKKYDAAPYVAADSAGSIPFIDFADQFIISGASYSPQTLSGLTQAEIATQLQTPTSKVSKAVLPVANQVTAVICKLIDNKDASVCSDPVITQLESKLGA